MKLFFLISFFFLGCFGFQDANANQCLPLEKELYSESVHWLDLPIEPLEVIGNIDSSFSDINLLIQQYHKIEKSTPSNIPIRINFLNEIADLVSKKIKAVSNLKNRKFLNNIFNTAKEKSRYLLALEMIRTRAIADHQYIENYVFDVRKNATNHLPLFLVNMRSYDSKLKIYWGEYYLEYIDPCHRFLTPYHDLWLQTKPTNRDYFSFFCWLENQNVHFEVTSVYYLPNSKKAEYEVIVQDGKLHDKTSELLNCCQDDKEYLFLIDLDEKMYIFQGSKEIRHTTLSWGKPVLAAGNIIVSQGVIRNLGLESGHYQPNISNGKQLIEILLEKRASFSSDIMFDFYHNGEKLSLSLSDFLEKANTIES